MKSKSFPVTLALVLFLIAIVNGLAQYHHWYWTMRWFDMPMHFTGGAWLAGVALWARFFSGKFMGEMRSFKHVLLWGLGVALCVGVVWELYEMVVSYLTGKHINDMVDTASDVLMDGLGALLVSVGVWIRSRNNK